jgi:urease subunit beta
VAEDIVPGELLPSDDDVTINGDRETAEVAVANTGDRPVQVGSHFHFFEANAALAFDRDTAYGMRLDIPAGTAIRFEPGDEQTVDLVAIGGERVVSGMNGLVDGPLDEPERRERALTRAREGAYGGAGGGA